MPSSSATPLIFLLSPAKSLDMSNVAKHIASKITQPQLLSSELVSTMQQRSASQIKSLLGISDALASLNAERYSTFDSAPSKPAVLAFDGPAYKSLWHNTPEPDLEDLEYLQQHLRILSGLYGLLRPLDAIKPYRLEMGTKLPNSKGPSLYVYWTDTLTSHVSTLLGSNGILVNCASQEYAKALDASALPMLTISFPGPAIYAKQARGAMVRFAMLHRVDRVEQLKEFTGNDNEWRFDHTASSDHEYVFVRASKAAAQKKNNKKKQDNTKEDEPQPSNTTKRPRRR